MFKQQYHAARDRDGLAIVGMTKHQMMGIRYVEGEGGTPPAGDGGNDGGQSGDGQSQTPPATPQAPPAQPAPQATPPQEPQAPVQVHGDRDEYIRELRTESKERRIALEKLQAEHQTATQSLATATEERDRYARELAVVRNAAALNANADLLLDSASFQKDLASVDPSDTEAVKAAITAAIEKNAAYKTGPVLPPSSGGGHQGGQPSSKPLSLDDAVKKALGG
ncbi:hypothetical protein ACSAGD_10680 [Paramicrobacterium sp. CJ85]|uniref:hypothetical protein n=1 Tax=Paramicrobacterium sp. CJ85 TaxID=3445355 RepID=UPI003F645498